jgi:hypothetical protein
MIELPGFGLLLARLSQYRQLDVGGLSRSAMVSETELQAVLDGGVPGPSLLRRIAPALNLHIADLFVMAGLAVPDDVAPLDVKATSMVDQLVRYAIRLPADQRRRVRRYAQSLPQQDRSQPAWMPPVYEQYEQSLGAIVVRMLRNRNLDWSRSATILFRLTGLGPLAASTIGAIGHGRKELTPELLVGFATVLAIPVDDFAALTGIEVAYDASALNPAATEVAELIWDVRRLAVDQVRQVCDAAKEDWLTEGSQ